MTSALKPSRLVLLAAMGASFFPRGLAQVSPPLLAPLTNDPVTAPITTLAVDLLAPQRPFIFDPSGASLLSSSLNPSVYASSSSLAGAETDAQLRDASQTGHFSPYYASPVPRLGLTFSGDEGTNVAGPPYSSMSPSGPFARATGDSRAEIDPAYRSSWGSSSSFVTAPENSGWGIKAMRVQRLGQSQPDFPDPTRTQGRIPSVDGGSWGNREPSTEANVLQGRNRHVHEMRLDRAGGIVTADQSTRHRSESTLSGTAQAPAAMPPTNPALFPGLSSSEGSSFGSSPFSAPGGTGSSFLNPNIFAAATLRLPSSFGRTDRRTQSSLRGRFVRDGALDTSATHYGLSTHPSVTEPGLAWHRKASSRKRVLPGAIPGSESP